MLNPVPVRRLLLPALGLLLLSALSNPAQAQSRSFGGGGGDEQARTRMKELMAATDEEWQVIGPKIERVQTTQRATSLGRVGMSMLFGGGRGGAPGGFSPGGGSGTTPGGDRGERGGRSRGESSRSPEATPAAPGGSSTQTPVVEQKANDVKAVIDRKDAGAQEIKAALAALREARAAAKAEHLKAQEELRELLTVRQETVLVIMGVLE